MTPAMAEIYQAISELMDACIKELRKSNKIDASELTIESGLFKSFDDIVRRQLDSIWHTVSPRTKQAGPSPSAQAHLYPRRWLSVRVSLHSTRCAFAACLLCASNASPVFPSGRGLAAWQPAGLRENAGSCAVLVQIVNDLKTMRTLAEHLLSFDAVTFLAYLDNLRITEGVASIWLFHDAAHTIFEQVTRTCCHACWYAMGRINHPDNCGKLYLMDVPAQAKRRVYVVRRAGTEKGEVRSLKKKAGKRAKPETGADDAPGDCCGILKMAVDSQDSNGDRC